MVGKKMIEVALSLEAINKEAAREKSIRHGHPSTLHLWWPRRPLAACRAVLFASLVDDPSGHADQFPTEEAQDQERQRLFRIIEELVKGDNTNNETALNAARAEILKSTNGLDPFCGGGSIPLEAQRLGLEAHASDPNPVAVLITKALIEIPPKFVGKPPVNPEARKKLDHSKTWQGAEGLAEDGSLPEMYTLSTSFQKYSDVMWLPSPTASRWVKVALDVSVVLKRPTKCLGMQRSAWCPGPNSFCKPVRESPRAQD